MIMKKDTQKRSRLQKYGLIIVGGGGGLFVVLYGISGRNAVCCLEGTTSPVAPKAL